MLVKFCGLQRLEDIDVCNQLLPDYIGFIFWPKSKRYITITKALTLKQALSPSIKAVGVFLDATLEEIKAVMDANCIDMIQLHGHEDEAFIHELRTYTSLPIIKAMHIETKEDIVLANDSSADLLLLDSKKAGSGQTFDWSWTKHITRPFILAGGLNKDNLLEAYKQVHPYGIDMSSSIETDGNKDPNKMEEIIKIVRGIDND